MDANSREKDNWADNLTIPENSMINEPKGYDNSKRRTDNALDFSRSQTDLELYSCFQGELYEFDFWTGNIESGTIYLKAFEVTKELPLSESKLPRYSSLKIFNPTDSIMKFGSTNHFTIFEGDWEKYYAARFEVWFKPDNEGKERKLFEKIFKIEGWQR